MRAEVYTGSNFYDTRKHLRRFARIHDARERFGLDLCQSEIQYENIHRELVLQESPRMKALKGEKVKHVEGNDESD